jgi:hypothetical protein
MFMKYVICYYLILHPPLRARARAGFARNLFWIGKEGVKGERNIVIADHVLHVIHGSIQPISAKIPAMTRQKRQEQQQGIGLPIISATAETVRLVL